MRDITGFVLAEQIGGRDPRTLAKELSALRSFFRFEVLEGRCAKNPARLIDLPKMPLRLPRSPDPVDIDRILEGCNLRDACGVRDLALYELIFGSGLRESEACDITLDRISLEHAFLGVMGKGRVERLVPVDNFARCSRLELPMKRKWRI